MDSKTKSIAIANETVSILKQGFYITGGKSVNIRNDLHIAKAGTVLYKPNDILETLNKPCNKTVIEITKESTIEAALRIADKFDSACALNFASAKNPGGGFLRGSVTQEESLAKASGLYACIEPQKEMYEYNRKNLNNGLYSDYMIYSPRVPTFRDKFENLLPYYRNVSYITSPAVNLSFMENVDMNKVHLTMQKRIRKIFAAALQNGEEYLILGAFGCGVFKNDPKDVAMYFKQFLDKEYKDVFKQVTFAIYDTKGDSTYQIFKEIMK
jgi:uncharacterized protein (TIGR02452 family)